MTRLSQNYERMQSTPSANKDLVDEYRDDFAQGAIGTAQALITSATDQLVMNASKLNSLVETINYMQAFWAADKEQFESWFMGLFSASAYDTTKTYHSGTIVSYSGGYYICIVDGTTGAWNASKWMKLGYTGVGLTFRGEYDANETYTNGDLTIKVVNNIPTWQYYNGSSWVTIGYIYGNLRYLEDSTDAYDGEIYITPGANS